LEPFRWFQFQAHLGNPGYSLIASCKRHRFDPFAYLRNVIARIPTHPQSRIRELLPVYWKPATSV
jgi:hypothetical protein